MANIPKTMKIFCSYAHEDEKLRDLLEKHLKPLERMGIATVWHDRCISPGSAIDDEITEHIESSHIILLLISADFISSEYCYTRELKFALERHHRQEATVIPVILRPCHWEELPLAKLNALPSDGKAITEWGNQDKAFEEVCKGVSQSIKRIIEKEARGARATEEHMFDDSPTISDKAQDLLRVLGSLFNRHGDKSYEPEVLAKIANMSNVQVCHYLHELSKSDLVFLHLESGGPIRYSLSSHGIDYLCKHELI